MVKESKEERFVRLAEKRVQNVLKSIKNLSQVANSKVYQWNTDQVKTIMDAIEKELEYCRSGFEDPDSRVFKFK